MEKRKKKGRGRRLLRGLLLAVLLLSALFLVLQKNLEGVILDMAHARAEAMAVNFVQQSIRQLTGGEAVYSRMMTVHTDAQGRVTMLEANTQEMNRLSAETALLTQQKLDMEAQGLTPINTFTLGPVLVENGEARIIKETITGQKGEFQYRYPQQRVAIVQLGKLEYAIVEAYGKTDSSAGMTLQEMADFITYLFPDCIMAYNLDGGGSTNVVVNGERIHTTPGRRDISDILYFASAYTAPETENAQ